MNFFSNITNVFNRNSSQASYNYGTGTGSVSPVDSDMTHMEVTPSPPSPVQRSSSDIMPSRSDLTHAGVHGSTQVDIPTQFYAHPNSVTEATMNNLDSAPYRYVGMQTLPSLQTYNDAFARGGFHDRMDIASGSAINGTSNTFESRTGKRPSESDMLSNGLTPAGRSDDHSGNSSEAQINGSDTGEYVMSPSVDWSTTTDERDQSEGADDEAGQMDLSPDESSEESDESEAVENIRDQMDLTPDAEVEDSYPAVDTEGRRMHLDSEPHVASIEQYHDAQAHEDTSSQPVVADVDMAGAQDPTQFFNGPSFQLFQNANVASDERCVTPDQIDALFEEMYNKQLQDSAKIPMVGVEDNQGNAMKQDHGILEDILPENDMPTGEVNTDERFHESMPNDKATNEKVSDHQMTGENVAGEKATVKNFTEAKVTADKVTDDELKDHETTNQPPIVEEITEGKVAEKANQDDLVIDDKATEDDVADKDVMDQTRTNASPVAETLRERTPNAETTMRSRAGAETYVSAPVPHANEDGNVSSTMQPLTEGPFAKSAAEAALTSQTAEHASGEGELVAAAPETIEELVKEESEHVEFTAEPQQKIEGRIEKEEVEMEDDPMEHIGELQGTMEDLVKGGSGHVEFTAAPQQKTEERMEKKEAEMEHDPMEHIGELQETVGEITEKEVEHTEVKAASQDETEGIMAMKEVQMEHDQTEHKAEPQETVGDITVKEGKEEKQDIQRGPVRNPAFLIEVDEAKVAHIVAMVQNIRAFAGLPPPDDEVKLPTKIESEDTEGKLLPATASAEQARETAQSSRRADEGLEEPRSVHEDRISHPAPAIPEQAPKAVQSTLQADEALDESRNAPEDRFSHPAPAIYEQAPKADHSTPRADEASQEPRSAPEDRFSHPASTPANALPSPLDAAEPQPASRSNWVLDTDIWSPDLNLFFGDIAAAIRQLRDENIKVKTKLTKATNKLKDHENLMKKRDSEIAELRKTLDGRIDKLTGQHNKLVDRFVVLKGNEEEKEAEPAKAPARGGGPRGRGKRRGGKKN